MMSYILLRSAFIIVFILPCLCDGQKDGLHEVQRTITPSLRVTSILGAPYLQLKQNSDEFEGFISDLLANLSRIIGFNYEIRLVRDGMYGSRTTNGSWNGMIGELIRRDADIAAAGLTVTSSRMMFVDFTYPFMNSHVAIIMKKRHSTRANIRSLRDLARQSVISYSVLYAGSAKDFFKTSKDPDYESMWSEMVRSENFVSSTQQGVNRVLESTDENPWAHIGPSVSLRYFAGQMCDLEVIEDTDVARGYALAVPLGSNYFSRLNLGVVMMIETGQMSRLRRKWWPECA